ncbi:flavodoxin family protein [Emergencia sp.]|uniref:flavodoxin family protein n=1 Tax=Emergencia sp. TaxID=1926557 RepID=UPI003AF02F69
MKVLLVNGSPNEKGCTWRALMEAAGTLKEEGIDTELLHLGKEPIAGCIGCGKCRSHDNRCVLEDTAIVNEVLDKMKDSDGMIVGSPVYFASPSGALIALMDRVFMAGADFEFKPAAAVTSARRAGTTATLEVMNKYFLMSGMPVVPANYCNMVHGHLPEEVEQDLEGLQTMRVLARNMAYMLKCLDAGEKQNITKPKKETKVKTSYIR